MTPKPIRAKDARTIAIEVDHRTVSCPEGATVLRAAELNGIFIPSLCSHKDLSPFGGCRLCVVEIAGMRGYPLACSTVAQEGMKILTETSTLREMRREILELILSEHPSSCLVCGEKEACRDNVHTVRKSGVSTGCRYCPNDGQCELQTVVERLGVTEIHYPVYYREYEPEHEDPFFDRDYNICILCGRCVRMCQEVRGTSVLAFKFRGPKTQVGPAFGRTHVEAGCEFCGACVSVCPTGTLADKASKWDGQPDGLAVSTCPFCALGCQLELHHKDGQLSKAQPHLDPEINDGQLCVRGRFCLPETTHNPARCRKPVLRRGPYFREVSWPEALDDVASRLANIKPTEILMVVSPDLSNEGLYAAQKFMRSCLRSNSLDSTARWALPGGPGLWADLFSLPISVRKIAHADSIIAVGLDSRFSFSVAGVEVRRALKEGATLVTIDARDSNLARYTRHWLRPRPGGEGTVLQFLTERLVGGTTKRGARADLAATGVDTKAVERALEALTAGKELAVLVGPTAFATAPDLTLATALYRLAMRPNSTILPLYQGANTRGALELGVFGELLPGLKPAPDLRVSLDDVLTGRTRPTVLYLVGESPFFDRPQCDYLIAQDLYRPPFEVDAFLPAASFAEAEGTLTNVEGRVQQVVRIENLPDGAGTGYARPDWFIFGALAERLGRPWPALKDAAHVLNEISETLASFPASPDRRPRKLELATRIPWEKPQTATFGPDAHRLVLEPGGFRHRGTDMSFAVEGLSELALEEGFRLHPDDLRDLGVTSGGTVTLAVNGMEVTAPAKADAECPAGAVYVHRPFAYGGLSHRKELEPLYRLRGGLHGVAAAGGSPAHVQTAACPTSAGQNADSQGPETYRVVERRMIVPNLHVFTVEAPQVAAVARPGNFVILRPDEIGERVPLSVADWDVDAGTVTSIFLQVGASTAKLARLKPGDSIPTCAGPLGKETEIAKFGTVLCIGGCYGIGSIYPIVRALHEAGNVVYTLIEGRSRYLLYWQEKLRRFSARVIELTRDGSAGYKGHISRLPEILTLEKINPDRIIANGCTFLMMRTSGVTRELGVKTTVNMNPIMIDGTGMCGVCRLTVAGKTKFACVDGPDFDGHEVDWEEFLTRRKTYNPEEVQPLRRSGCTSHY
jgi:NADH dehydrogenase/NADH:ubiquinone oxidoreductase subunit G/NAD(P)H-flavin reductase